MAVHTQMKLNTHNGNTFQVFGISWKEDNEKQAQRL